MSVNTNQETMCKLPDQYFPAEFTPGERTGAGLIVMFFLHPLITQHTSVTVLMFSDVFGCFRVCPCASGMGRHLVRHDSPIMKEAVKKIKAHRGISPGSTSEQSHPLFATQI